MLLTPEQLQAIREIIADRHSAFIVNTIGIEGIAPEIVERLKAKGIIGVGVDSIRDAYLYGHLVAAAEAPGVKNMSYPEFQAYVRANPVPLSSIENDAIQYAKEHAGRYARGLGNRVDMDTGEKIGQEDVKLRQEMRDTIQTVTGEGLAKRKSLKQLKSDLGWATKDWTRDWERIANTESQFAMQTGVKDYIAKNAGVNAEVWVQTQPDHCPACVDLYERGGKPIIFDLAELEGNGTNVGVKRADWRPVIPPAHPHCQCGLMHLPPGFGFNIQGQMVPGGKRQGITKSMPEAQGEEFELRKALQIRQRIEFQGIAIAIENEPGSIRQWVYEGESGATRMAYAYGYVLDTIGADSDGIDVFVGPFPDATSAYVVHQQNPSNGFYDEDKVMLGFSDENSALAAYQSHYNRPDFAFGVSAMPMDAFKRWINAQGPKPYGLEKSVRRIPLVIRLEKAQPSASIIRSSEAAAASFAHTLPAGRNGPGQGTAPNLVFKVPPTYRPGPVDLKVTGNLYKPDQLPYADTAVKRDPKVYEYQEPVKARVSVLAMPDTEYASIVGTDEVERNRNKVERWADKIRASVKNTVEPESTETQAKTKKKGKRPVKRKARKAEKQDDDEDEDQKKEKVLH